MSPAMPTTVRHAAAPVSGAGGGRGPGGWARGGGSGAAASLTTATLGAFSRSVSRTPRPRTNGISSVRKYSGPPASIGIRGYSLAWEDDRPSTSHGALNTPGPKNGGASTGGIAATPGSAWSADGIRSSKAVNFASESAPQSGTASQTTDSTPSMQ